MLIDLKYVLYIMLSMFAIGGAIVKFFQMQTGQNMKIEELKKQVIEIKLEIVKELDALRLHHEKELDAVKRKQSVSTGNQIETEKNIVQINTKLDHILDAIAKLEKRRESV
jgi:hypothetical protein